MQTLGIHIGLGHDCAVRLWDTGKDAEEAVYRLGPWWTGRHVQFLFTPDGRHLITGNANGTIYVYRLGKPPRD